MKRAPRLQVAYTRVVGPLIMVAIFLFCSTFGMLLGLTVRIDHPEIEMLSVYPTRSLYHR